MPNLTKKCPVCKCNVAKTCKICPHDGHDFAVAQSQKDKDLKRKRRKQGLCENCGKSEFREQKELVSYLNGAAFKSRINFFCIKCGFENRYKLQSFDGKAFNSYDKETRKNI